MQKRGTNHDARIIFWMLRPWLCQQTRTLFRSETVLRTSQIYGRDSLSACELKNANHNARVSSGCCVPGFVNKPVQHNFYLFNTPFSKGCVTPNGCSVVLVSITQAFHRKSTTKLRLLYKPSQHCKGNMFTFSSSWSKLESVAKSGWLYGLACHPIYPGCNFQNPSLAVENRFPE